MATEGGLGRPDHGNRPMCYSLPTAGVAIVALERLAPFCARARFMNTTLGHEKRYWYLNLREDSLFR